MAVFEGFMLHLKLFHPSQISPVKFEWLLSFQLLVLLIEEYSAKGKHLSSFSIVPHSHLLSDINEYDDNSNHVVRCLPFCMRIIDIGRNDIYFYIF
jgi:hypothetical protein